MVAAKMTWDTRCPDCRGSGMKMYPNTATWKPWVQLSGQAFTSDVCNSCWGSGDVNNPGEDLVEKWKNQKK